MRRCLACALPLIIAACAASPSSPAPPAQASVAGSPDAVRTRLAEDLRRLGFAVQDGPAGLQAEKRQVADPSWADCPIVMVSDDTGIAVRRDWARPRGRDATVTVGLGPAGRQTDVHVVATFTAGYVDRYRATAFTDGCSSTGTLERRLLTVAQG
jgi:hypothetical protein